MGKLDEIPMVLAFKDTQEKIYKLFFYSGLLAYVKSKNQTLRF
jgi:hypothetical protein